VNVDGIFGNFLGNFLGIGSFDEPPDSVPLRILGLSEMPADEPALRSAFVRKARELHPDLNPLEENSWREVAGGEWEAVQWARAVLLRKLPPPRGAVTETKSRSGATLNPRNGTGSRRRVTDRSCESWVDLSPRNTRILAEVEREVERREGHIERGAFAWRDYAQLSEDERFTKLAVVARLVCSDCVEPLDEVVYLHRRNPFLERRDWSFGDGLKGRCGDCWGRSKSDPWHHACESTRRACMCGVAVICTGDRLNSTDWWYANRGQSCSPLCARERANAEARERRRTARSGARCSVCDAEFSPGRAGARYCSSACRQDAYRKRKAGGAV
jgi:hypothetical protein